MFDDLPQKHYQAIVVDPPWKFRPYSTIQVADHAPRNLERHYNTMSIKDILAMPVRDVAAPDCHLFLWVPGPNLISGLHAMRKWGFKYSAIGFCWVKLARRHNQYSLLSTRDDDFHVGLGLTTRHNIELCLLGRRGNARRLAKDVRELIVAPVRQHSRKPDEVYERVERYCAGPFLELFARSTRPGWTSWGNEVGKFDGKSMVLPVEQDTPGALPAHEHFGQGKAGQRDS